MLHCRVLLATFPPSFLVYSTSLINRKDAMRATAHTLAIYWRRINTLGESADMSENPKCQQLQSGDYLIEASAVLLSNLWYPEYQVSKFGHIIEPRQRPACFGFEEKTQATWEAIRYAIDDLNAGEPERT